MRGVITVLLAALCPALCPTFLGGARAAEKNIDGVVNINTATPEQLQLLPGIGPAKVRNVLAYRRHHPFRTAEELVRIKGVGRKMVRRLRPHITVSGPTTAAKATQARKPAPAPAVAPAVRD